MTILISGGHLTPALAFIDYLERVRPDVQVVFAGRALAQKKNAQPAHEALLIEQQTNTDFEPFSSGKWGTGGVLDKFSNLISFANSLPKAWRIFHRHQPDIFLSFGGYLAVPLALIAKLKRVPIVTHEQTHTAGWANQVIALLAAKVALSYPESAQYFPPEKIVVTGSLVRSCLFEKTTKPSWLKSKAHKDLLYITGGSQGSEIINSTFASMMKHLVKDWTVIHQCGRKSKSRDYKMELERVRETLPDKLRQSYNIREWVDESELGWILQNAKLAVSRAGANTVEELLHHHLPAILIPLSFAHNDEQKINALYLVEKGGAILIEQKDLSPELLKDQLALARARATEMRKALAQITKQTDGDKNLFSLISELL